MSRLDGVNDMDSSCVSLSRLKPTKFRVILTVAIYFLIILKLNRKFVCVFNTFFDVFYYTG